MADPLSLAVLSASITGLLMRGAAVAVDPSWGSAASLPGDALNAWRSLRRLQQGRGGQENPLEASIKARLQEQVDDAGERYKRTGATQSALAGAVTEMEVALTELSGDDAAVIEAVRFPNNFETYLRRRTAGRRRYVEAAAESFFDDLTRIVADEFIRHAPGSRAFDISALKQLLAGQEQIRAGVEQLQGAQAETHESQERLLAGQTRLLDQHTKTHERLDKIVDSINNTRNTPPQSQNVPKRIHFGSRPTVTADFVSRAGQDQFFNAIITRAEPKIVLTGMRGTGKTQLAAAIATKCEKEDWPLVAWINAASRKELVADLYELATRISTDTQKSIPPDIVIQRCLDAMSSADTANRLFIFDNVDDFDDLKGLIPRGNGIRVVLTTTRHLDWNSLGWSPIKVGTFQRKQSIDLLCERTGDTNRDAADQIAEVLGDLPVAVTQAAATARNERYTLSEYLDRLNGFPLATTIEKREGGNYPETVSTALWLACKTTVDIINRKNPKQGRLAVQQISMLSLLAAPGVPIRWLEDNVDRENAKKSLSALFNSSVCQTSTDNRKALIHRLQGRAFRENHLINETEKDSALTSITQTLENIIAHTPHNPSREQEEVYDLIEQLGTIASQEYSQPLFTKPTIATILARTLRKALELGMHQVALTLVNSVAKASDALEVNHPDILSSRNSLADAYLLEGQVEKAIALLEENLKHSKTIPGTTRHNTQTPRNDFMSVLRAGDRINKATTPHQQTQKDRPRILGPDHPEILASRNNLAGAYREAGRLEDAITLYQQNLQDRTRLFGPSHPDTLASRNNLASAYQEAGRLEDAITLFEQTLEDRTRILGPDHPDTLATRNNLASTLRQTGRLEDAITLYQQNLQDRTRLFGPSHPDTLATRNNLANAYQDAGKLHEAIKQYEQTLEDSIHIRKPNHPDTLATRHNLAVAYQEVGRLEDAITLLEQTLEDQTHIFGPAHPGTLTSRNNLAVAYQEVGRLEDAITRFERNLEECTRILGPHHPDTLLSRNNLAYAYQDAGKLNEAIPLYEQTLTDSIRILGPDHPHTVTTRSNLADAYRAAGRTEEAEALFETPSDSEDEQDGTEEDPDHTAGD